MLAPERGARPRDRAARRRASTSIRGDLYRNLTPWQRVLVARHPARPTTLDYVERLFTDFVELHGDRRFADDHAIVTGTARLQGRADPGRRPPEGQRHQAEDLPQLRLRAARGLSQGAADDAAGAEVRPADHLLRRHAGGVSRHRVRGARRRRSDRAQPARDGDARRAGHRRRARRRRQRRRARHRRRRPHPDARVRDLQRHPARRLRRDPVARRRQARSRRRRR